MCRLGSSRFNHSPVMPELAIAGGTNHAAKPARLPRRLVTSKRLRRRKPSEGGSLACHAEVKRRRVTYHSSLLVHRLPDSGDDPCLSLRRELTFPDSHDTPSSFKSPASPRGCEAALRPQFNFLPGVAIGTIHELTPLCHEFRQARFVHSQPVAQPRKHSRVSFTPAQAYAIN